MITRVTSTTHALALAMYLIMVIIGAMWATGAATSPNMDRTFGEGVIQIVGIVITLCAGLAGVAAMLSPMLSRPVVTHWLELVACCLLALGFGSYWWSIGGTSAVTAQWLVGAFALGPAARVVQVGVELRRLRV